MEHLLSIAEVDVNQMNKYGYTALMLASRHNRMEVVERIVRKEGIDLEAKNKAGRTAEALAREKGRYRLLQLTQFLHLVL